MRVLLDTHAVIWAMAFPDRLSRRASGIVTDGTNEILVSAVSGFEIATKVRIGKLPGFERLERDFLELVEQAGYTLLSVNAECALRAGRLAGEHKDPFGRLIAAQALREDMPLLSVDAKWDQFGIRRIW